MSRNPIRHGRRNLLIGLGASALAIPILPSLLRTGHAQPSVQKNFISYRITNGYFGHQWYPADAATEGELGLQLVEPNVREMQLSDIQGPISTLLDEKFDPFRSKMILMRHIDRMDRSDHQGANGLFGWSNMEAETGDSFDGLPASIDKLMAEKLFANAFPPLNLSVRWTDTGASCSYSVTPEGSLVMDPGLYPEQAFEKLFTDFEIDEDTASRRRGYKQTIVDRVLPHYREVRGNPRLSSADQALLDQHVDHMQTLSQRLSAAAIACSEPGAVSRWELNPEGVNAAAQAQVDIAVAALRCGLTHVVNFYLDPDVLMDEGLHGVAGGHHGASHDSSATAITSIENAHHWHMGYLASLLGQLDASEGAADGQTLLDQSLVFVNNEIGNQNGSSGNRPDDVDLNHIGLDVQTLLVGSCGGALRTGTFLDYRTEHTRNRWTQYIGTAYNRVLTSCMLAMGLEPGDWSADGSGDYGDLRGAPFDQAPPDRVVIGDMGSLLPRLGNT